MLIHCIMCNTDASVVCEIKVTYFLTDRHHQSNILLLAAILDATSVPADSQARHYKTLF